MLVSGTFWLTQTVHLILHSGNVQKTETDPLHPKHPHIEHAKYWPMIEAHPSPRLLKSHLAFHMFPPYDPDMKMIYILRNPKDQLVSYFHSFKTELLGGYPGSWDEFFKMAVEGYLIFGDWFSHTLGWWSQSRVSKNLLLVTYEEMKSNFAATIQKISKFLDKDLSAKALKVIEDNTSFSAMKGQSSGFDDVKEAGPKFFRKGEVGDWKNYFTVAQNEQFDEILIQRLPDPELRACFQY